MLNYILLLFIYTCVIRIKWNLIKSNLYLSLIIGFIQCGHFSHHNTKIFVHVAYHKQWALRGLLERLRLPFMLSTSQQITQVADLPSVHANSSPFLEKEFYQCQTRRLTDQTHQRLNLSLSLVQQRWQGLTGCRRVGAVPSLIIALCLFCIYNPPRERLGTDEALLISAGCPEVNENKE